MSISEKKETYETKLPDLLPKPLAVDNKVDILRLSTDVSPDRLPKPLAVDSNVDIYNRTCLDL